MSIDSTFKNNKWFWIIRPSESIDNWWYNSSKNSTLNLPNRKEYFILSLGKLYKIYFKAHQEFSVGEEMLAVSQESNINYNKSGIFYKPHLANCLCGQTLIEFYVGKVYIDNVEYNYMIYPD